MTKFITILSGKGGVGKTTSAINLGLAMAKKGIKLVVMDGNLSSPNLSIHLGRTYYPTTIHDVMSSGEHISNAIYTHHTGLNIIPAEIAIEAMRLVNFEKLRKQVQDLHMLADYVIIDGSPGLGRETTALMDLTDEVLIILNADKASAVDARRVIDMAKKFKKTIIGAVLTKYKNRSYRLSKDELEKFLGIPIIGTIPEDKRFEKSLHQKTPYLHLYPRTKPSKAYTELASRITGKPI